MIFGIFAHPYSLLRNDRLLNHSSNGFYLRWWRKALITQPDKLTIRNRYDEKNDHWNWKVQLNQFPSAVALSQPSRSQCQ